MSKPCEEATTLAVVVVRSVTALAKISASKPEGGALVCPNAGHTLKQPLDRHGSRLETFNDRLDDVGRQISKSQKPAHIGVVKLELPGDF